MSGSGWSNQIVSTLIFQEGTGFTGLFFYSPTVGHGNLVGSWTANAGTDPYGNTYPAGLSVDEGVITGGDISGATITGGTISGTVISGTTIEGSDWQFLSNGSLLIYSGTPAHGNLVMSLSPAGGTDAHTNVYPQGITVGTIGASTGPSINIPNQTFTSGRPEINFVGPTGAIAGGIYTDIVSLLLDLSIGTIGGPQILFNNNTGNIEALSGANFAALNEGWNYPALGAGFTFLPADEQPRYQIVPVGTGGYCSLDGTTYTNSATAANSLLFTLPTAYRPTERKRFIGITNSSGYTTAGQTLIEVDTNGQVIVVPACNASGQQIVLDGMIFPVD